MVYYEFKGFFKNNRHTKLLYTGLASWKNDGIRMTLARMRMRKHRILNEKEYMKNYLPSKEQLEKERRTVFDKDITFSIIVPLYNTPVGFLREMIQSVQAQTYSKNGNFV